MTPDRRPNELTHRHSRIRFDVKELLRRPYASRGIPAAVLLFSAALLLANRLHLYLCSRIPGIACIPSWPVSLVFARVPPQIGYPNPLHIATGIASLLLLLLALRLLARANYSPQLVTVFGIALILATTLTHGWQFGLTRAAAGLGNMPQDYYQDALQISGPLEFLRGFTDRQPDLAIHSKTHPPGAVLTFFLLQRLVHDPAIITIAIAALASILTALVLVKLLAVVHDCSIAGRTLFLYFLIPSVQIYYAASLDALIAPLVLGSCVILFSNSPKWWVASVLCLLSASFLSFGALFVLPVVAVFEVWQHRRPWRTLLLAACLLLFYAALNTAFGFNYLRSFAIASGLENPDGFRLLAEPANYLMTRVEDVAEVVLFFGPFLSLILLSAVLETGARSPLNRLSLVACGSFLLVLPDWGLSNRRDRACGAVYGSLPRASHRREDRQHGSRRWGFPEACCRRLPPGARHAACGRLLVVSAARRAEVAP